MAGYQGAEAYDFSLFEPRNESAARQIQPQYEPEEAKPQLRLLTGGKTQLDIQRKNKASKLISVILCCAVFFSLIVVSISGSVKGAELTSQINAKQTEIKNAQSENVRLSAAVDGMFSISNVETYATDVLGMKKMENYQIRYVDLSTADQVLYSGADSAETAGFMSRIAAYFSELFA